MEACVEWLDRALPALALGPAAGEAEITAVCELALLLRLAERGAMPASVRPLADRLPLWLATQARHPALDWLTEHGPPLALTAPLMLHAALGPTRSPFDQVRLLARCAATRVATASPLYWRQRELADLFAATGGEPPEPVAPRFLDSAAPEAQLSEGDAYCFTHEVFHETAHGARPGPPGWRNRARTFHAATLAAVIAARHVDLAAEYRAAAACLALPLSPAEAQALDPLLGELAPAPAAPALSLYHPRLAVVLAALCSAAADAHVRPLPA